MNKGFYFSNNKYKDIANDIKSINNYKITQKDAFLLLIKDLEKEELTNLLEDIGKTFTISKDEAYNFLKSNIDDDLFFKIAIEKAVNIVKNGNNLGTKVNKVQQKDGTIKEINTTDWISHSINVGLTCKTLAKIINLDEETAFSLGILHDIGRKKTHTFEHTIKGFELLVDEGYEKEAVAALSHSFVNGGRCASNERAEEGWYITEEGIPNWKDNSIKDDITIFLENYEYNDYDKLLNIADLTATSKSITSIYDRIQDIATRREIDETNRGYFFTETINLINEYLYKANYIESYNKELFTSNKTIEEQEEKLKELSKYFYNIFIKIEKQNKRSL